MRAGSLRAQGKPGAGADASSIQPLPSWCYDHAFSGWWMTRTDACEIGDWILTITDVSSGTTIGQISFLEISYSYTSPTISTWAQQLQIAMYSGWGATAGTMVQGEAVCGCTQISSNFPPQTVDTATTDNGESFFNSTATAPGAIGSSATSFGWWFTNPNWIGPSNVDFAFPPGVRCDNALPGSSVPGCVFPDYTPAMIYSQSGTYPQLAQHISDAQNSGLPGAYPNGTPLQRLTDQTLIGQNRTTACPPASAGGYPRPPGLSCDEYPFASTYQGAATAQPPGGPRTFPWCQITLPVPDSVGAVGYSVCMIDDTQNQTGGSALGVFYNNNRVLDKDPFYVWITP
jgi:hypothetical protein